VANNNFYPSVAFISAITNAQYATVTFTADHEFTPGQLVSFRVGPQFGMSEINQVQAKVLTMTSNSITVPVDTLTWTPFSLANLNQPGTSPPCCVPSASGVIPFEDVTPRVTLFDAFDNRPV
jgi:hypothetical protein